MAREINFLGNLLLYSPKSIINRSALRSFGFASLLRALPSVSRKGAALDPAGSLPPAPHAAYAANYRFAHFLFYF